MTPMQMAVWIAFWSRWNALASAHFATFTRR